MRRHGGGGGGADVGWNGEESKWEYIFKCGISLNEWNGMKKGEVVLPK